MRIKSKSSLNKENKLIYEKYLRNLRKALRKRSLKIKEEELSAQKKYASSIPTVDNNALFWLGLGLYWAEGAKTERWRAVFYNSQTSINRAMLSFFRGICGVKDQDIRIQLVLHKQINANMAIKYWSKELQLSAKQFFRPSYGLSKVLKNKRPVKRLPHGTVQISIKGKPISNKMKGWILGLESQFTKRA